MIVYPNFTPFSFFNLFQEHPLYRALRRVDALQILQNWTLHVYSSIMDDAPLVVAEPQYYHGMSEVPTLRCIHNAELKVYYFPHGDTRRINYITT